MITDQGIKAALRSAPTSGKRSVELKDEGPRGAGRLALIIRVGSNRLTPEWYAVWYESERRQMTKIGTYPAMSLIDARKDFKDNYAPAIAKGERPQGPRARTKREAGDSFGDLCRAFADSKKGNTCWKQVHQILLGPPPNKTGKVRGKLVACAVDTIGDATKASTVTTKDCIGHLKVMHDRGSLAQAELCRAYLSSMFNWAIRGANSYHAEGAGGRWGIVANPVLNIARNDAAYNEGQRNLSASELRDFWQWLESEAVYSAAAPSLLLMMATGQRPGEILCLTPDIKVMEEAAKREIRLGVFDAAEKMLFWPWTKNGLPHSVPLCDQAVEILSTLKVRRGRLYFPGTVPDKLLLDITTPLELVRRYLALHPEVAPFTPRDLRRTWKTLSGRAGISKEWRDRLQNHSLSDVSSKHYDRYDYLPERRAAVKTWGDYLGRILSGEIDNPVVALGDRAAV